MSLLFSSLKFSFSPSSHLSPHSPNHGYQINQQKGQHHHRKARKEEITGKGTRKGRRHLTPRGVSQEYGAVLCHDSTIPLAASCGALGVAPMSPGPWISSCTYPAMPTSSPPYLLNNRPLLKTTPQVRDLQILRPQIRRSVHRCAVDMSDSNENFSPSLRHLST